MHNLWDNFPKTHTEKENISALLENDSIRIERIVSYAHKSPEGFWYEQEQNEWVILLEGSAVLEFKDPDEIIHLKPGDYILIRSKRKHRVLETKADCATIWLTVFYGNQ